MTITAPTITPTPTPGPPGPPTTRPARPSPLRTALCATTIAATVPYLTLKVLWVCGVDIGVQGSGMRGGAMAGANAPTIAMEGAAVAVALALVRPWGERIPAWVLVFPMWVATGFLAPIVVGAPAAALAGMASRQGAGSGGNTQESLSGWVFALVYGGFGVQGVALGAGFVLHVRGRWGRLFGMRLWELSGGACGNGTVSDARDKAVRATVGAAVDASGGAANGTVGKRAIGQPASAAAWGIVSETISGASDAATAETVGNRAVGEPSSATVSATVGEAASEAAIRAIGPAATETVGNEAVSETVSAAVSDTRHKTASAAVGESARAAVNPSGGAAIGAVGNRAIGEPASTAATGAADETAIRAVNPAATEAASNRAVCEPAGAAVDAATAQATGVAIGEASDQAISGALDTARRTLVTGVSIFALLPIAAHLYWAAGGTAGRAADPDGPASRFVLESVFGLLPLAGVIGALILVRRRDGAPVWWALVAAWTGTASMFAWGLWWLLAGSIRTPLTAGQDLRGVAGVGGAQMLAGAVLATVVALLVVEAAAKQGSAVLARGAR